ncbi:MAG: alpha/beta fold hydrolase [Balneolaceae bacterium]|nr:alpha/beta fold hydrolase [Balneolaceae bacterium]
MQQLEVNGARYAFKIHQKDTTLPYLIMLHGFMGDHRVFDHLIDDLKQCCNPITVDLLGHGQSEQAKNPSRYFAKYQIQDLKTLIAQLNISPFFLYGYSMGGRLSLRLALEFPELCYGLILESTNDGIEDKLLRKERMNLDEKRANKLLNDFDLFLSDWQKLDLFKSKIPVDKTLEKKYRNIQRSQKPEALAASLLGFSNGNMESVRSELD